MRRAQKLRTQHRDSLRRLIRQQIQVVQEGGDPIGVSFDPNHVNRVGAGNYFRESAEKA